MEGIKVTKKALKGFIKYKLRTDNQWALRALLFMYGSQTSEEQTYSYSTKRNGKGFDKNDAKKLSVIAECYKRYGKIGEDNLEVIKKSLPKYWEQILNSSDSIKLERAYRNHIVGNEQLVETTFNQQTKDETMARTPIILKELESIEKIQVKSYDSDKEFNSVHVIAKDGREYITFPNYKSATKRAMDILINHEDDPNVLSERHFLQTVAGGCSDEEWAKSELKSRGGVEGMLSYDGYNRIITKRGAVAFRTI